MCYYTNHRRIFPRGGIYLLAKMTCKFDFRSAYNKIPKTTAFTYILTLISGISYIKSLLFFISVEFTFAKWNLILQRRVYFFNSPFWNIDKLVDDVQKYLFDEHILGAEMQSLLRKALYFIDESDYRNEYFECIIDDYLLRLKSMDTPKERRKKLSGLYLAGQMIAQYTAEVSDGTI